MSEKTDTMIKLEALRAKLHRLQMQQEKPQTQQQKHDYHISEASYSNSFNTPSSTQQSTAELTSTQNTASSLHLPEREKFVSNPVHAPLLGSVVKQTPSLQQQGNHRSKNLIGLSESSYSKLTDSLLNTSTNRTADLTDRSLSRSLQFADSVPAAGLGNEVSGYKRKAVSLSTKTSTIGKAPYDRPPLHPCQPMELEVNQSRVQSGPEHRPPDCGSNTVPALPWLLGRSGCQNTDEFKVPQSASSYTDSQMEIGSSGNMDVADMPSFTHPSSASKHSMQRCNSTPEIRSSGMKAPSSQVQISKLNLGKPMRVRKQQHPVSMLSNEIEDDTDLINSIKPLTPSSHVTSGRFVSLASSGYRSDMTMTTEDSSIGQAAGTSHKSVSLNAGSGSAEHNVSEHGESKMQPQLPHYPPAPPAAVLPQGVASVMSTPSCKGLPGLPSVVHTPSGEMMDAVSVNGERYCILKKVGQGGSAQVYMVFDANKNIRALKVVDLKGAGPETVDGFRNEINLLQRLQYCNSVIKMFNFELNETLNCLYVVLEFGETDLSQFFSAQAKQNQGLDPMLIKFYWREMLRAVNALHNEGVIHSDLKPANFMLVAGKLKLIDFGIANTLQQDKTSVLKDARVGTPSYMSPEAMMTAFDEGADDDSMDKENQAKPKYKVGVRSDVWSLGCILYNMVYGRTPFQHIKSSIGKLQAIVNPACPIKFPNLPDPHLLDVLQKCLTRDVKLRPTTTELLAHPYLFNKDRLQELLKSQLVQGSPRTANAVNRVMDLLQELESGQK